MPALNLSAAWSGAHPERRDTSWFTGPWWPVEEEATADASGTYHVSTALRDGTRGILIDTGAHDSLTGPRWMRGQAADGMKAGTH